MAIAFRDWGALFKAADKDKDGVIDYEQLKTVLGKYGYQGSDKTIKEWFHKEDVKDADIRVSRVEFTKVMNEQPDNVHVSIMMRRAAEGKKQLSQSQLDGVIQEMDSVMAPERELVKLRKCLNKYPGGADIETFIDAYLSYEYPY